MLGGPHSRVEQFEEEKNLLDPPALEPRTVQPVAVTILNNILAVVILIKNTLCICDMV
jgi:hypothetical protein